jgi:hypothetical protein
VKVNFVAGEDIIVEDSLEADDGQCFTPGKRVGIWYIASEKEIAATTADADGGYRSPAGTEIPTDARTGAASIQARGELDGTQVTYSRSVNITGAGRAGLPDTGRDIAFLTLWGVGFVVFGSVLITATYRRWRDARFEDSLVHESFGHLARIDGDTDPVRYQAVATTWTDSGTIPDGLPVVDDDALAETIHDEEFEAAVVTTQPEPEPEPVLVGALNGHNAITAVVDEANARTSDVVTRLREEISAWTKR